MVRAADLVDHPGSSAARADAYRVDRRERQSTIFALRLEGRPGNWPSLCSQVACVRICDAWLDTGRLPALYVTPR